MTDTELVSHLRERVGSPSVDTVSERRLREYLASALEWLAGELEFHVRTLPDALSLTAETYEYPLPADCLRVLWLEWNETKLEPGSVASWVRDGRDWRNATAGNPTGYAVEGRQLVLYPPPSSDAVTTDGAVTLSYLATSPGVDASGVPGLTNTDLWCAVYAAAIEYLGNHPTDENQARLPHCREQLALRLPQARARHADAIRPSHQRVTVWSARQGGAR